MEGRVVDMVRTSEGRGSLCDYITVFLILVFLYVCLDMAWFWLRWLASSSCFGGTFFIVVSAKVNASRSTPTSLALPGGVSVDF